MRYLPMVCILLLPAFAGAGVIDTLWLRQYVGTSSSQYNQIADIAVDTLSNSIYVCGSGEADPYGGTTNILIQRYDLAGNLRWSRSEGGNTLSQDDMGHALAVDSLGNVFVAGVTYNSPPRGDDATWLKYDSAGNRLFYLKSGWGEDDAVYDILIGDSGHIYMCGMHVDTRHGLSAFLLVKANGSTGDTIWTREYIYDTFALAAKYRSRDVHPLFFDDFSDWDNCATALSRLPSGKIAVTGFALDDNRDRDMWTMLFSPNGTRHWARIYYNLMTIYHDDDVAFGVAASNGGDIYVAGFDYLETDAIEQGYNYAVVRYDSTGVVLQSRSYNVGGVDGDDYATSICLDQSNPQNVYTTGTYDLGSPYDQQVATHRFSRTLTPRWGTTGALYGGAGDDRGHRVLHSNGRVYVAGIENEDLVTLCYTESDPSGQKDTLWAWHLAGGAGAEDYASSIAVLDTGRVFVGGQKTASVSPFWNSTVLARIGYVSRDLKLIGLTGLPDTVSPGDTLYPGAQLTNIGTDSAYARITMRIGADWRDTVVIAGAVSPAETVTVAFRDWTASTVGAFPVACTVATTGDPDLNNNRIHRTVVVAIREHDVGVTAILAPVAIVDSGQIVVPRVAVRNFGTTDAIGVNVVLSITPDYSDTVAVDRLGPGQTSNVDFLAWQANTRGAQRLVSHTVYAPDNDPTNDTAYGTTFVRVTDVGVISIVAPADTVDTGQVVRPAVLVRNLGTSTAQARVSLIIGDAYSADTTLDLRAGSAETLSFRAWTAAEVGTFDVIGFSALIGDQNPANDTARSFVTVLPHTGVEGSARLPVRFALEAPRPSPFSRVASIVCALPQSAYLEAVVFDATGKLVRTLVSSTQPAGRLHLQWDGSDHVGRPMPDGVYYCCAKAGENSATRKLVVKR